MEQRIMPMPLQSVYRTGRYHRYPVCVIITRLMLGFCCLSLLQPVYAADPDADDGKLVGSSIREVTVYADRARVIRLGSVDLTGDLDRFAFAKLPGWID